MKSSTRTSFIFASALLAACTRGDSDAVDEAIAATTSSSSDVLSHDTPAPQGPIRFTLAPTGNAARYRVREQLMRRDLPNDAIGETQQLTGGITIDSTGAIIPNSSRFSVNVASLTSDSDRRDGYVRGRILETEQFPKVELVPTTLRGMPAGFLTVPTATVAFDLIGNLTVHGVTRPTTWRVTAQNADGKITGSAATKFTFSDFGLATPRVPIVLSVADTIKLEYDFTLIRDTTSPR